MDGQTDQQTYGDGWMERSLDDKPQTEKGILGQTDRQIYELDSSQMYRGMEG